MAKTRSFVYTIEQDEDGVYVAAVPELPGCHTQARSLDELHERIHEAIALYCDVYGEKYPRMRFVGIQQAEVPIG